MSTMNMYQSKGIFIVFLLHHFFFTSLFAFSTTKNVHLHNKRDLQSNIGLLQHRMMLQDDADDDTTTSGITTSTHLVFPGGGIFFYWQAGVVSYLREQDYDLSSCTFSGASAGALTATLTAGNVDFYEATDLALGLAARAKVWDRSSGLQGIWGPLIYEWLDTLLPNFSLNDDDDEDSKNVFEGRLSLLVTPVPSFGKSVISTFSDKEDLIRCNMASVHIPWFLDGKLTSPFRGSPHIDGSFLSKAKDYLPTDRKNNRKATIFLDWSKDPVMESRGGLDIVEALSPEGIWGLVEQGKTHAKILEEKGAFKSLTMNKKKASKGSFPKLILW